MNPVAGTVVAERYRLERPLGQGGMGAVWLAQHVSLKIPCAVKFIHAQAAELPAVRARFEREAVAAAQLRSPHVVQILDHGVWEEIPYIAMELLEGEDLQHRLHRRRRLDPHEVLVIVTHVGRALTKAHALGLVHRDLKPANVFLVRDEDREIAKILDFGIAKSDAYMAADAGTKTGSLLGTPYYMSPEQAQGARNVDHRSDLWALGVLAYECLTGTRPFAAEGLGEVFMRIMVRPLPVPSEIAPLPRSFDAWWNKAVCRDVDGRFQTARELTDALGPALGLSAGATGEFPRVSAEVAAGIAARPPSAADTRPAPSPMLGTPAAFVIGSTPSPASGQTPAPVLAAPSPGAVRAPGAPARPPSASSVRLPPPAPPARPPSASSVRLPNPPPIAAPVLAAPAAAPMPLPSAPAVAPTPLPSAPAVAAPTPLPSAPAVAAPTPLAPAPAAATPMPLASAPAAAAPTPLPSVPAATAPTPSPSGPALAPAPAPAAMTPIPGPESIASPTPGGGAAPREETPWPLEPGDPATLAVAPRSPGPHPPPASRPSPAPHPPPPSLDAPLMLSMPPPAGASRSGVVATSVIALLVLAGGAFFAWGRSTNGAPEGTPEQAAQPLASSSAAAVEGPRAPPAPASASASTSAAKADPKPPAPGAAAAGRPHPTGKPGGHTRDLGF